MTINEKDRLDLRQELERVFSNPRFAEIAMEAMPPIDYAQLATKRDLDAFGAELRGEIAELRGEFAELRGEFAESKGELATEFAKVRTEAANNLRLVLASQLGTAALIIGWVSALN